VVSLTFIKRYIWPQAGDTGCEYEARVSLPLIDSGALRSIRLSPFDKLLRYGLA
jgi:hypothetical protein